MSLTAREELERVNIKVSVVYPYTTNTRFEENIIKGPLMEDEGG
jgi:short-subunit dehydrogenase